ncbi:copper homeostasis protein CutC [Saccharicrinis sp. GN24d3]|uniref:copper homeostasis protein CutC n=1 Tax=Saccharicrinis sp. GN24d3 TaxID=3458416 RepID=UPI0040355FE3
MNRNDFEIEICAGNIQSVIEADKGGADRVELCDNLIEGGTTPSGGTIAMAKKVSNIDIFPIIRLRGGNFVYDELELRIMLQDIKEAISAGADGVVIGALNKDGSVNIDQCQRMIEAANGLPVTFHRAFDQCKEPFEALDTLMSLGISRLLTSGQKFTVTEGAGLITRLHEMTGDKLTIMPGGGINEHNIVELAEKTGVKSFHASLREVCSQEPCFWRDEVKFNGTNDLPENQFKTSSKKRIRCLIEKLEKEVNRK